SRNEINDLKKVNGRGAPRFGKEFTSVDGRVWYLEEFIEGPTAEELRLRDELTIPIRRSIVRTLFAIGVALNGLIPRDAHLANFVIRKKTQDAVMVDIGDRRLYAFNARTNPRHQVLLAAITYARYGNQGVAADN